MSSSETSWGRRVNGARAAMSELGLDGLLVSNLPNIRYLCGFSGSSACLFITPDDALFFTDGRYEEQAQSELAHDTGLEVEVTQNGLLSLLAPAVATRFGGRRAGFEAGHLVYRDWDRLREEAEPVEWTATTGLVERLRMRKEPAELEAIRKAARVASAALDATLKLVRPGMTEIEVAAELDYHMARHGSPVPAFETIVAGGPRSALPHAQPGARRIEAGDLVLIDFGARLEGYCCDITRTFVMGEPSQRQLQAYDSVLEAYRAACSALAPGVRAADVDAAARRVLESNGLGGAFPHSTGHGIGLEVHEGPRLHRRSEEALADGMVVTVEPGLYFQGWGGVRIEDDLVVSAQGGRSLVDLPKEKLGSLPY